MRTIGWEVNLPSEQYRCPALCASCGSPQEESVEIGGSRSTGFRQYKILRLLMPYCRGCAARWRWSGRRMMALFSLVTILSIVLPALGATTLPWLDGPAGMVAGGCAALALALMAALVLVPGKPRQPATAPGEAVTVSRYDEKGVRLFCTNRAWAEEVAAANRSSLRETSRLRLMAPGAIVWSAVVAAGAVFLLFNAGGSATSPSSATKAPAARSASPARSAPAAPAPPKRK